VEHVLASTVGQLWWQASSGLSRSLSVWDRELNRRLRNARFAGANTDRSGRQEIDALRFGIAERALRNEVLNYGNHDT
jgi:hypothetical protein